MVHVMFCSVFSNPLKSCKVRSGSFLIEKCSTCFVPTTVNGSLRNFISVKPCLDLSRKSNAVCASVQLEPDKRVPVVLLAFTVLCSRPILNWEWLEVFLGVLTIVAFFQVFTYTIEFTENDFRIIRNGKLIRSYPYTEWLSWRFIPSAKLPILLYFKEYSERRESTGGPLTRWHLLPVLYNPTGFVKMIGSNLPGEK